MLTLLSVGKVPPDVTRIFSDFTDFLFLGGEVLPRKDCTFISCSGGIYQILNKFDIQIFIKMFSVL